MMVTFFLLGFLEKFLMHANLNIEYCIFLSRGIALCLVGVSGGGGVLCGWNRSECGSGGVLSDAAKRLG